MSQYANPDVLVSTDWLAANLNNPGQRIVEISVDPKLYEAGHIPGAVNLNWNTELQDQLRRDIASKETIEHLLSDRGVKSTDTIILYGDHSNWFAAYAFWLLKVYGHQNIKILNGGRAKWLAEESRPLVTDKPAVTTSTYKVSGVDESLRAKLPEVLAAVHGRSANLVDVRSPDEFSGKIIAPPGMNETAQRAGHIPGAKSVPWSTAVKENGEFKSPDELREIYFSRAGVVETKPTIAYCRIGERSSHTWFVLKYLLGLKDVRNYDGSWTEYGNLIGAPIER
ncbi:MAG: sulfurtransferase [Phycisphaerales bacterium]|nr:sulfurtransferase [Phycisphaerales bacterium]